MENSCLVILTESPILTGMGCANKTEGNNIKPISDPAIVEILFFTLFIRTNFFMLLIVFLNKFMPFDRGKTIGEIVNHYF